MTRRDADRLADILGAATAITAHLERGDLSDGLVFDAVRVRLIEIGEAVKSIDRSLLDETSEIPWDDLAAMRNHLVTVAARLGHSPDTLLRIYAQEIEHCGEI